jgi:agmatine deiminase
VLVTWPLALPRELVVDLSRDVVVHVVVFGAAGETGARTTLLEWGIPADRVAFIQRPGKDGHYGTRDWGPFAVYDEHERQTLRDPRYIDYALSGYDSSGELAWWAKLEPGLDWSGDDIAPQAIGEALGLPREELPFSFTGGNVEVDGRGRAFATQILEHENAALGVPPEELRAALREHMGIRELVLLPNFERFFGAQHIDCVAKLLDEQRWLVKRVPDDHPDRAQIELLAAQLAGLRGPDGQPYEVLRIETPRYAGDEVAAYTNALILNRHVYVPLFGIPGDEAALATYRAALPHHTVKGYLADERHPWTYTDALHCRTRAVWR